MEALETPEKARTQLLDPYAVTPRITRDPGTHKVPEIEDDRFYKLLGPRLWKTLPFPIRRRFSKRLRAGAWTLYRGRVPYTRFSWMGKLFSQLCRLIGGPLPICGASDATALVAVTARADGNAQLWTRIYGRPGQFHQVVQSEKRFAGPTGLEEHVGKGIGMSLSLHVADGALHFRSEHYFLEVFGRRLVLPKGLSPGKMEIIHAEEADGDFSFTLRLTHPLFGRLVSQRALFKEVEQ